MAIPRKKTAAPEDPAVVQARKDREQSVRTQALARLPQGTLVERVDVKHLYADKYRVNVYTKADPVGDELFPRIIMAHSEILRG